ncbi:hypothetical protein HWV62_22349 [Athelia sp. TMB]|nr:hypothetical protein HWV62_22349 [Athelia sp. TMB]
MLPSNSPFSLWSIICLCLAFIATINAQVTGEGNIPSASSAYIVPAASVTDTSETAGVKPMVYYPSASGSSAPLPRCEAAPSACVAVTNCIRTTHSSDSVSGASVSSSAQSTRIIIAVCLSVGLTLILIITTLFIIRRRTAASTSRARRRASLVLKNTEWGLDPKEASQIAGPKPIGNAYPFSLSPVDVKMPTPPPPATNLRGD